VQRRDILTRCFDIDHFMTYKSLEEKMFYLTSQNEGRNAGIIDGKYSGFEWSVILDGNTFITADGWMAMQHALTLATENKKQYLKIPYHRVHAEQDQSWLNKSTDMESILNFAPMKGESQIAFFHSATEMFTLGDTKPENRGTNKQTKGYGQRNKSYLFKEGAVCAPDSKQCACADVVEGNEEDMEDDVDTSYTKKCGLVLRLWSYPTQEVIHTGLSAVDEDQGFFCYILDKTVRKTYSEHANTECNYIKATSSAWLGLSENQREKYKANNKKCREQYAVYVLKESCFRSTDREIAQLNTAAAIEELYKARKGKAQTSLCQRLRPPPNDPSRVHYLTVFDDAQLDAEKALFVARDASITPLITDLLAKANRALGRAPYTVTSKTRTPADTTDKRFYYSIRPYFWPKKDWTKELADLVKENKIKVDHKGFAHYDGHRLVGTIIGGENQEYYDRSTAWYVVENITTLALAWKFTGDEKYATKGAELTRIFFIDKKVGMYPSLLYAQDGDRTGLIDWKDFYYLLDAIVLLERSGKFTPADVNTFQVWCATLAQSMMTSQQGHEEGRSLNNHAVYFDLSVLSLSLYSKNDDLVDITRTRIHFRLTKVAPIGHFGLDGSPPHETTRPTALHYVTFNLIGWIHLALAVEAARQHSELPGAMESLWWVRHEGMSKENDDPVLCKAIRWLSQYLPPKSEMYESWQEPTQGMGVNFNYSQVDHFAFDRMLEIIHYGVGVYGVKRLFPALDTTPNVKIALDYPLYSTKLAMFNQYSSVDPDSGTRAWPMLGVMTKFRKEFSIDLGKLAKAPTDTASVGPLKEIELAPLQNTPNKGGKKKGGSHFRGGNI